MNKTGLLIIVGISLTVFAFLSWLISRLIKAKKQKAYNTLESCFGEPSYSDMFSLSEVKRWVKSREEKLQNNCKAVVLKANSNTLSTLGRKFELKQDGKNYLVIAIVDNCKQIGDSVLIQYNKLDDSLEDILSKGDGVLVIGG